MLRDISQGNGVSKEVAFKLLNTPSSLGGIGMFNIPGYEYMTITPGSEKTLAKIDSSTVKGLVSEVKFWRSVGVAMTDEEAIRSATSNLELTLARKEILKGKIETTEKVFPFKWTPSEGGGIPLMARGRKEFKKFGTLETFAVETKVRAKDWVWIREVWLDGTLRQLSDKIEARGGRRVWIDWILGKLPWHSPVVPGWGDLLPSTIFHRLAVSVWTRVVSMQHFSYLTVKRAAVTAELWCRHLVSSEQTRIGG
jgi:hypothetical protein